MNADTPPTGRAIVGRYAWMGAKISLIVLIPILFVVWSGMIGLVLYKSASWGISPIAVVQEFDSVPQEGRPWLFGSRTATAAAGPLVLMGVGVGCSVGLAAGIGAVEAWARRVQQRKEQLAQGSSDAAGEASRRGVEALTDG